jgi:hypothetical protein
MHHRNRRLAAVLPESSSPPSKPAKKMPPPSSSQISYQPVWQQQLPAEGVAVLKLQLTPAAASGAVAAGDVAVGQPAPVSQQEQQQPALVLAGVRHVGCGKAAAEMWLMQAAVSPWTDADSLAVWASRGAVLQQGEMQEQHAAGGAGSVAAAAAHASAAAGASSDGGLSLMLDGKPVESFDAFMQQLLAASQQQQQQ